MGILNPPLATIAADLGFPPTAASPTAALLASAAGGALAAGSAAAAVGPSAALAGTGALFAAGSLLAAGSRSLGLLCLGRSLAGAAAGAASALAPGRLRALGGGGGGGAAGAAGASGALGSLHQVAVCAGIVLATAAGLGYDGPAGAARPAVGGLPAWRAALAAGALPGAALAAGMAALARGGDEHATPTTHGAHPELGVAAEAGAAAPPGGVLRRLLSDGGGGPGAAGAAAEPGPPTARAAVAGEAAPLLQAPTPASPVRARGGGGGGGGGAAAAFSASREPSPEEAGPPAPPPPPPPPPLPPPAPWSSLPSRPPFRAAAGVLLAQQASGINTVILFSATLFARAGVTRPVAASLGAALINLTGASLAASLVDRAGRVPLLVASHSAMACFLALLAASPALPPPAGPAAAVGAALAFVAAFSLGAGPVAWVYAAEVLPPDLRDRGGGAATAGAWVANLVIGSTCPWLLVRRGGEWGGNAGMEAEKGREGVGWWVVVVVRARAAAAAAAPEQRQHTKRPLSHLTCPSLSPSLLLPGQCGRDADVRGLRGR